MAEAFVILTSEIQAKSPISFINSNKGKPLLVADDYTFKLNKATTTTKYWICTINGCAAKVNTDLNNWLMKTVGNHSHLPGKEKLENTLLKLKCFSLYAYLPTTEFDNEVVPFLRRMSHLEKLA
ncbi:unnamed protein product [Rotaria magnacalcarata]|uniref:FLYWCH-type domain-containing protein n=1 Tax=Rotaria magnacalcarata TaxID=392030 RepID=A0A816YZB2_9BILA|nr:unnamed protein product [Rotaria magnacalcarata]